MVTRLHILGYQNANIESINDGKDYIDSANIGLWSTPREDYVTFPDDDLPEDLLSKGTAYLATVDTPRITLSVDLAQVRTSAQYALYKDLETVQPGRYRDGLSQPSGHQHHLPGCSPGSLTRSPARTTAWSWGTITATCTAPLPACSRPRTSPG